MTPCVFPQPPSGTHLAPRRFEPPTRSRGSPLSSKEERELVAATDAGDPGASPRLGESVPPALRAVARRFGGGRVQRTELMQEGVAALLFAAKRYDPRMKTP